MDYVTNSTQAMRDPFFLSFWTDERIIDSNISFLLFMNNKDNFNSK